MFHCHQKIQDGIHQRPKNHQLLYRCIALSLYIYNESRDILTPYTEFVLGSNVYTFLIPAEALPEGFTETSVSIGEYENVTAYAIANPDYADFVLVYAFNRTNEPGFYLYDTAEGTLQRCVDETLLGAAAPSPTDGSSKW